MAHRSAAATYMAECFWPDVHADHVEHAVQRIRQTADELTRSGTAVELTTTILVPGDDVVLYLFSGSAEAVRAACVRAHISFERVVSAVELDDKEVIERR